jgi:probable HAF family extracellular repeat protein
MKTLQQSGNFWILCGAVIALARSGGAVAQTSYQVTDLGALGKFHSSCAMTINDRGWIATQNYNTTTNDPDGLTTLSSGRDALVIAGYQIDLGTLGGANSFMNWGEINERGQIVGYSEAGTLDPNGEDVCGFGTNHVCLPFVWEHFHMRPLPILGGNNGQASAINDRGQIVGTAETAAASAICSPHLTSLPVLWENGKPQSLPTVDKDTDGEAFWINDLGEAVGQTYNCNQSISHAVSWTRNGTATALADYGTGAVAFGNNDRGQIIGAVGSPDNSTEYAAIWQNGKLTSYKPLPGDFGATASGNNNRGHVVGSTFAVAADGALNWSHAVVWRNGVMTDLNTLVTSSSNLYITMANKINERGQISAMAIVRGGPGEGNVHAVLLTPVNERIDRSVAEDTPVPPQSKDPASAARFLRRFGLGRIGR